MALWLSSAAACCLPTVQHRRAGPAARVASAAAARAHAPGFLVLWRGDATAGFSRELRHTELASAIASECPTDARGIDFVDALPGGDDTLQYLEAPSLSGETLAHAAARCALVREVFAILSCGADAAGMAASADLAAVAPLGSSWSMRVRRYGTRCGSSRLPLSSYEERDLLAQLRPLTSRLRGPVNLASPDSRFYFIDGVLLSPRAKEASRGGAVLARVLSRGREVSRFAPATRLAVTTTPLEARAAFVLANAAAVRPGSVALDPYAGSCSTLLACAALAKDCVTVGIERDEAVPFDAVVADFLGRGLPPPHLLRDDCRRPAARAAAREAAGGRAFDAVLADPPYGRRERRDAGKSPPLGELIAALASDREHGRQGLLRVGGRLAAYAPLEGARQPDAFPGLAAFGLEQRGLSAAGLRLIHAGRQMLSRSLSRWLLVFVQER